MRRLKSVGERGRNTHMDSSGLLLFLVEAEASSCSLILSTAWAFFSSSEKLLLLTFWAPRPPFLEANCSNTSSECDALMGVNIFWAFRMINSYCFLGSRRLLLQEWRNLCRGKKKRLQHIFWIKNVETHEAQMNHTNLGLPLEKHSAFPHSAPRLDYLWIFMTSKLHELIVSSGIWLLMWSSTDYRCYLLLVPH